MSQSKSKAAVWLAAIIKAVKLRLKSIFLWKQSVNLNCNALVLPLISNLMLSGAWALLPANYWQIIRTLCLSWPVIWQGHELWDQSQLQSGHVKIPSPSGVPSVRAAAVHSGEPLRNNKLCPVCLTGPSSFVYHLFITSVSIELRGQRSFKWQMGGTFEHVMWSSREHTSRAVHVLMKHAEKGQSPKTKSLCRPRCEQRVWQVPAITGFITDTVLTHEGSIINKELNELQQVPTDFYIHFQAQWVLHRLCNLTGILEAEDTNWWCHHQVCLIDRNMDWMIWVAVPLQHFLSSRLGYIWM